MCIQAVLDVLQAVYQRRGNIFFLSDKTQASKIVSGALTAAHLIAAHPSRTSALSKSATCALLSGCAEKLTAAKAELDQVTQGVQ